MFFLQFSREKITRKLKLESISSLLLSLKLILEKPTLATSCDCCGFVAERLARRRSASKPSENEIEIKSADAARLEKTKSFV